MQSSFIIGGKPAAGNTGRMRSVTVYDGSNGNKRLSINFVSGERVITFSALEAADLARALLRLSKPEPLEVFTESFKVVA